MAQIGYGYGSEYQLLRFLGHHRHLLEAEISRQISECGTFNWLDFGFADREIVISGDDEHKGMGFLWDNGLVEKDRYDALIKEYKSYQINKVQSWQNWDAIFVLNDVVYLVEAKAHVRELSSGKNIHGGESSGNILRFMQEQLPNLNVTDVWLKDYYQLGNRLATTALLNKHGIKCKTLCIFFCNGYLKQNIINKKMQIVDCKDATKEKFIKAIVKEHKELGIDQLDISNLLAPPVFIDANPK
jgi:hypothetical protein